MTDELLDRVAAAYGLKDLQPAQRASPRVWKAISADGDFAVKFLDAADVATARLEATLLVHLTAPAVQTYRVQKLAMTTAGQPYYADGLNAVVVTHWAAGSSQPYTTISVAEWQALGRSLASLHERLATFGPMPHSLGARLAARNAAHARESIVAGHSAVFAKAPDRAERLALYLNDQLALFDVYIEGACQLAPVAEQPIHNDFNQHNYLFDGIDPPRILDWDRAIGAPREYDVVRCLNHLPIAAPGCASALVAGYQSVLPLRRAALRWALNVAMVEHALKRWPIERWLNDLPGSDAQLEGMMEVVRSLASANSELDAYYSAIGDV